MTNQVLFQYLLGFDIEPLLVRFAHGEGLARQCSVMDNALEEAILGNRRQIETGDILTCGDFHKILGTVNVVNRFVFPFRKPLIEDLLNGTDANH